MKVKIVYILLMILPAVFLMAEPRALSQTSGKPALLLKEADQCRKTLYDSAKKKRYRHNWLRCIRGYERVYNGYLKSDEAAWALYHSARLFAALYTYSGRSKDLDEAVGLYRRLVNEHPRHRLADDAQYLIGEVFYKYKKNSSQAYTEFSKVDEKFPSGDMLPRARKMISKLAPTLKKKDEGREASRSKALSKTSKKPALLLKEADGCRKTLYRSEKKKKHRRNWLGCIQSYERIYTLYPKSDEAAWALYNSARLFTGLYAYSGRTKDLDEAIGLYRRLVNGYRKHRLADDAQYGVGEILYKYKKNATQAYVEFLKVDIQFPSGDMRPRARKMLDELAVVLSKKEEESRTGSTKLVAVKNIRHWSTPNYTRVVVDLESPVTYEHHLLKADPDRKKPRRLYLDLKNARVTSQIDSDVPIKDGLLQRARAGQYTKDSVRVVLDIESIEDYKVFHLHDPFRIVTDVRKSESGAGKDTSMMARKERTVRKGVIRTKGPDGTVSLARQLGLNVKTIVIDAGHGGKDPGCHARGNVREKNIVLSIAKILSKKLKKKIGCEVFLTRDRDTFLSLERRTAIANIKKADLFISLHTNAHKNKKIRGLETYFLNMATDERAVMVAARENATSEKNISDLQAILNDLMLNTKIHESSRLAHAVQKGMMSRVSGTNRQVRNLGVKQAPFYVLIGAQMPAILVETGFLTNYTERKRLLSKEYQEKLAEGICNGIDAYIKSIDKVYQGG